MANAAHNGDVKRRIVQQRTDFQHGPKNVSSNTTPLAHEEAQQSFHSLAHDGAKPSTVAATVFSPAIITALLLIFGGCCSNVYALESIVKVSPASGTLITFVQFFLTALYTIPSQLTTASNHGKSSSSFGFIPRLRERIIPLHKWFIYTAFFLTINMLNNLVFNYRISIPLHIILRSASPVTSMLVGYLLAGRRYTPRQVFAVILLFVGVVLAALSDANSKSTENLIIARQSDDLAEGTIQAIRSALSTTEITNQFPGFILLFSALILSAIMGLYTDRMYDQHGRSLAATDENLFYSHVLSLPWFLFQKSKLQSEYTNLVQNSARVEPSSLISNVLLKVVINYPKIVTALPHWVLRVCTPTNLTAISFLLLNALTQIVCITGVNRLSTETTSLTVTIVLNVRKLVSLLISIWLFGNTMTTGVIIGAFMVFVGGGMYGLGGKKAKASAGNQGQEAEVRATKGKQKSG